MYFIKNEIIILLFLCLLGCSCKIDEDLVRKLSALKRTKNHIYKFERYSIHHYVKLFIKTEEKMIDNSDIYYLIKDEHHKNYRIEMYDEKALDNLIKKFKKRKNENHAVYFMLGDKELEVEVENFIKYFVRKLVDKNIKNVRVKDKFSSENMYYYLYASVHLVLHKNNIVIRREKYDSYGIYIEETILSKECLTDLMKDHFDLYVRNISEDRLQELFKKYFFNHKLLSFNFDYFKSEETLLKRFPSEFLTYSERYKLNKSETDENFEQSSLNEIPDTKYLNVLFHLLQDSNLVEDMIKYHFSVVEDSLLFKRMLEYFKINVKKLEKLCLKEAKKDKIVSKELINKKVIDSVFNEIKKINIEDHIRNYKRISKFFYLFLKKINFKDLNDLIEIIKLILDDEDNNYNENSLIIFKKLGEHLRIIYKKPLNLFCYDLFHEKTYLHQEELISVELLIKKILNFF